MYKVICLNLFTIKIMCKGLVFHSVSILHRSGNRKSLILCIDSTSLLIRHMQIKRLFPLFGWQKI
jgi:hypothetical protein